MYKKNIFEYLQKNILLTDGAMNTYYKKILNTESNSEAANIYDENTIIEIHKKYIEAGAKLIRTNTFSANTFFFKDIEEVKNIIEKGYKIAENVSKLYEDDIYVGASIGPIPDNHLKQINKNEYKEIIDIFLNLGAEIFVFETFNSLEYIMDSIEYLKEKKPSCFVLIQFSLTDIGVTKKSISYKKIIDMLKDSEYIDAFGFNCGVGPLHMLNILKKAEIPEKYMSALPNAGYPEIINNKVEYVMSPEYFADLAYQITKLGIKIIGGCCGTTPKHIKLLKQKLNKDNKQDIVINMNESKIEIKEKKKNIKNKFHNKIINNKFIIAVELDPPFKLSADNILKGAEELKNNGVDIITIADSPMGKPRADSVIISSKIQRQVGIDTLPHICCRDRNAVSLRSSILGGYIEGIRNTLVVTGDPIPGEMKETTKSVFNLNSYSLINMINEMNNDLFFEEPIKIGGAVNFNVKNKEAEFKRLLKKAELGAEFFLTQPIFSDDTIEFIKGIGNDRNYKIFAGIMPLVTYRNAQFINNELPGITIPEKFLSMFSAEMTREESESTGVEISCQIAEKIKDYVDGFYIITPFNRYEMIIKILKNII